MPDLTPDIERELEALDDALAGRRVAPELTELGELALLLREDRPRPSDDFGRSLDARVARGFDPLEPAPRARRSFWAGLKPLFSVPVLGTAATVLLVVVVAVVRAGRRRRQRRRRRREPRASRASAQRRVGRRRRGRVRRARPPARGAPPTTPARRPRRRSRPCPCRPPPRPATRAPDGRANRKVERSASLTLAARPRDIDARERAHPGGHAPAGRLRRLLDRQLVRRRRRRDVRAAHPHPQPRRRDGGARRASGRVRERAQRSQDITAAGRLRPQPAQGRAHRAQEPAAPARRGDDDARDRGDPRAAARRVARDRAGAGRPAPREQPRRVLDRRGHAGRRPQRRARP